MLTFKRFNIQSIPLIEITPEQQEGESLPLAIHYHGWMNNKDYSIAYGIEIAKRGFRVVMADALYHGERRLPGQEKDQDQRKILQVIPQSVTEFPIILDYYQQENLIANDFIAVSGQSMGGMTVCMLIAAYPEISAGVCLEGTPNPVKMFIENGYSVEEIPDNFKSFDLSTYPKRISKRPMLFWHAQGDQWVDVKYVQDFYHSNKELEALKNTHFAEDEGGEHFVPYSEVVRMAYFLAYAYQSPQNDIWNNTQQKMVELYGKR